jgi:hypothetical protein
VVQEHRDRVVLVDQDNRVLLMVVAAVVLAVLVVIQVLSVVQVALV